MKNYLIQRYALSEEGAKDTLKSIRWNVLVDIVYITPAVLSFYLISKLIPGLSEEGSLHLPHMAIIGLYSVLIILLLFLLERRKYQLAYTQVYKESGKNRIRLAEMLRKLPLAYFGKRDLADLTSTIMQDATEIEGIYSHALSALYAAFISNGILALMLLVYQFKMGLALIWIIPVTLIFFVLSTRKLKSEFSKTHGAKLKVSSHFQEGIDSVTEIKAYHYEKKYSEELDQLLDRYEKILTKGEAIVGGIINFAYSLLKLGMVTVVIVGAVLFSRGEIDLFSYLVFMVMTSGIYVPMMNAIGNMALITYADIRIDRLKEIKKMPTQSGKKEFKPETYDTQFEDVRFSYEEGIKVINGISFEAKQKEVTALVGPSGGGKSTTAKLAARFWDIQSGTITLGGQDISQIDPETLLDHYAIVFQEVTLFNFSILENIRVGRKDAGDEEVLRVAKLAQCDEIAEKLPQGYDTLIGENGEKLSGGERQRISIARAMLKNAPIVILDEATASIDVENESKIQRALSELVKDKTVLIIAHRMRTVRNADKIVVLKEGKIAEMGSPDQLLQAGGIFAAMNQIS